MANRSPEDKGLEHIPETQNEAGIQLSGSNEMGLTQLGYETNLHRNRSLSTVLFQSLAIATVPFGPASTLTSAILGVGQLPFFVG